MLSQEDLPSSLGQSLDGSCQSQHEDAVGSEPSSLCHPVPVLAGNLQPSVEASKGPFAMNNTCSSFAFMRALTLIQ
jgi:hypothetical protein